MVMALGGNPKRRRLLACQRRLKADLLLLQSISNLWNWWIG